jgi:HrpA-like RNA helicase
MLFDWIAPSPAKLMVRALEVLYALGVMDTHAKLTSALGFQVAEVPLDPMSAKVLLTATESGADKRVTSDLRIGASGRERKGRETIRSINVSALHDSV